MHVSLFHVKLQLFMHVCNIQQAAANLSKHICMIRLNTLLP